VIVLLAVGVGVWVGDAFGDWVTEGVTEIVGVMLLVGVTGGVAVGVGFIVRVGVTDCVILGVGVGVCGDGAGVLAVTLGVIDGVMDE
jgi:hypothetical protein